MLKIITKVLLLSLLTIGLHAGDGLTQKHLVSVSPEASATNVSADSTIEVVFDAPIVTTSVKKNTIKLKNIKGTTTLVGDNTLRFTANEALESGEYDVVVKKVKLQNTQGGNTELKPKTGYEKFIYWLCSIFYDNPADCPLCKKICENSSNEIIKTKKIKYTFTVDDASPKIETIVLSETSIELHEGNETTLTVTAKYDDNTTQDISSDVEWNIGDASIISVNNGTVKALKEGTTTLQAKYKNKTSETITFIVYKEINGYLLPPEPDKIVNNATLLGVDSNSNGVRDDVERYIINKYNDEKIAIEIGFQYARAYNAVIEDPANAEEIMKVLDAAQDCKGYFTFHADRFGDPILIVDKSSPKKFRSMVINTEDRIRAYLMYDRALSGGVYTSLPARERKNQCSFDVEQMLKDRK